jgi:hypothetical protein
MNEQHDRSISTAIRKMAGTFNAQGAIYGSGEVLSVDKNARTAVVLIKNDVEITCRLMAQVGDGFLLIPSIGSTVFVGYFTYNDAYILMASDLDVIGLKGDELGGLVKVIELTEKLNNLEAKVNAIITNFNIHTHASLGAPPVPLITGPLVLTLQSEIENTNVTHGN